MEGDEKVTVGELFNLENKNSIAYSRMKMIHTLFIQRIKSFENKNLLKE
ncbi:hypothetical protein GW932_00780 [archaeon]|nr:hypothetical protein [archaeon]